MAKLRSEGSTWRKFSPDDQLSHLNLLGFDAVRRHERACRNGAWRHTRSRPRRHSVQGRAPLPQHRGLDPELGRNPHLRPAAALQQGHRLPFELGGELPSRLRWSMRDHTRTELTTASLTMATQRQRPAAGLVCHSALDYTTPERAERKAS